MKKSLKLNVLMNAILTISSFIFPLITFPYVSRILLPVGTGKVSFAISLITYFNMIAQLGIPTYGIRACAKVRDNYLQLTRTAHELLIINLIMSLFSYICLAGALIFIPRLREDRILYVIVSSIILLSAVGIEWLYKALEQYTYITVRSLTCKLIALITMFLLVHEQKDYVIYGGITILAASASNIFNLINAHKYIGFKPVGNYDLRRHMKAIIIFFSMSCATTIYTNLDTVMLGFLKSDEDVGYFNAAVKIKSILVGIVTSLGTVILPRASYYVEQNMMIEFRRINKKAINFVFILALPLLIYFIIFAKEGIYFLSGDTYNASIMPMQIIMPTLLFIGFTNILGVQILVPIGKESIVLYSTMLGAIVDFILNLILIPSLASSGAAIATLAAELVVLIYQYVVLRKEISVVFKKVQYIKIFLAISIAGFISYWISKLQLGSFFVLCISAILFFGSYGLVLLITKEPLVCELVGEFMSKSRKDKR